jgi:membrane fusion protein (multidrug efflux system)
MKKHRKILLVLALLAGLSYAARAFYRGEHFVFTDDATVESQVVELAPRISGTVDQVLVGEHEQVKRGQLLLRLDGRDYATAVQQARARLASLEAGQQTQKLRVLLAEQQTQAQLENSRARIQASRARLREAQEAQNASAHQAAASRLQAEQSGQGVETARRRWQAARQEQRAAQAQAQRAELDWQRYQKLYGQEAISRQQLDQARAEWLNLRDRTRAEDRKAAALANEIQVQTSGYQGGLQTSQAQQAGQVEAQAVEQRSRAEVEVAQAQLHQAESGLTQIAIEKQALKEIEARLAEARQQLHQAELNLGYTKIYAPWDGQVGKRPSEVGAYLKAGQSGLQLVSSRPWIVANFKETQLRRIRPGQPASIWVDVDSQRKLVARVDSLQPATGSRFALIPPENASGNWVKIVQRVPVKLVLEKPALDLLPGMSATVEVQVR